MLKNLADERNSRDYFLYLWFFIVVAVTLIIFFYYSRKKIIQKELEKKDLEIQYQKEL
jgi:membrane-associated HD superfamily phosphohydrolase